MKIDEAYNQWSESYDLMLNKTRDLEAEANQKMLSEINFKNILELGCGTGKNTVRFAQKAESVIAVDFSVDMLNKAKQKISSENVVFKIADITIPWNFADENIDLISCSLVLEHIQNLDHIFKEAAKTLDSQGYFYIGELHPFKQYAGSKARFEANSETIFLECYIHHISEFLNCARQHQFICKKFDEVFDEGEKNIPRIAAFLFQRN